MRCGQVGSNANNRWIKEKRVLKKLQMHFTFQQDILRKIRHEAADASIVPSDIVRKIIGLPYVKVQRPRVGLSFNKDELAQLAQHYNLDMADEAAIKCQVIEEVNRFYKPKDDAP
ncbi:hypothetical protein MNBD_GAMMA26-123 [hydrothermal vent metagenome]|uniref:Uncharacterized protein n=1 Tax=hydrothermal vent metagenome TaxID=652676 RepID=A0A3B1BBY3_9ZZZZ